MSRDDSRYDHNEGSGGATDLKARTAQSRYKKAGYDGRVNPCLRGDARRDPKRHSQRECH